MLQLLYSGAKSYLGQQAKKEYSLGGFPSSNIIQNSEQGSLFSNVSPYAIQNEIRNVIAVILKNNGDTQISNVEFYFNIPETAICKYEIAAVALTLNSKGEYIMEEISNNQSLPYNATFYEANGQVNAVDLGPLVSGAMLGLWIKRTIDFTAKTDDELFEDFKNGIEQINKEVINLVFNETEVEESSSSSIVEYRNIQFKLIERLNRTSDFAILLPNNIRLEYIDLKSINNANVQIGTVLGGNNFYDNNVDGELSIEIGQTYLNETILYFTINSGSVDIYIYFLDI